MKPDTKTKAIKKIRHVIKNKLQIKDADEIPQKITCQVFKRNGLSFCYRKFFNERVFDAIKEAYPNKNFKPWQFKGFRWSKTTKEDHHIILRWLLEEKLKCKHFEDFKRIKTYHFDMHNLDYLKRNIIKSELKVWLNVLYPGYKDYLENN